MDAGEITTRQKRSTLHKALAKEKNEHAVLERLPPHTPGDPKHAKARRKAASDRVEAAHAKGSAATEEVMHVTTPQGTKRARKRM